MSLPVSMRHTIRTCTLLCVCSFFASWSSTACAELLSSIDVYKENGVGVIHIQLSRPVIYTHHFPPEHSYLVHIYFSDQTLGRGNMGSSMHNAGRPMDEFMQPSPNDIVPVFWVAYNNHGTGDLVLDPYHLLVQFAQPVHYKIVPDSENQGFYIFVLSVDAPGESKKPDKQSPAPTKVPAVPPSVEKAAEPAQERADPEITPKPADPAGIPADPINTKPELPVSENQDAK